MSTPLPDPHPDCARCTEIERRRFKPSSNCGYSCDCTAYCEEEARFVINGHIAAGRITKADGSSMEFV